MAVTKRVAAFGNRCGILIDEPKHCDSCERPGSPVTTQTGRLGDRSGIAPTGNRDLRQRESEALGYELGASMTLSERVRAERQHHQDEPGRATRERSVRCGWPHERAHTARKLPPEGAARPGSYFGHQHVGCPLVVVCVPYETAQRPPVVPALSRQA
jgi:hypothetical protein